ncbi:MAG: hypothetical protein ABMB14_02295, partial [Myxococcota bacterium]
TAGVHQLEVSGMFGKKLYEAEIDLPDDTVTYVSWERGEIKVLKTEWLEDEAAAEAPASDEAIAVEEPAGEPPVDELAAAIPVEPPMLPVEAPVEPPPVPVEAPPVVAAAPVAPAVPVATPTEPVLAAPGIPVDAATALPMPKSKTLTVQAADGMRIEVVHNGHKMVVVVEGDTFKIQDANGMNLALSEE